MLALKRIMTVFLMASFLLACIGQASHAEIQVDFTRVYTPNYYGSSNYDVLWENAKYAITHDLESYGEEDGIGAFVETAEVTGTQSLVTNFESWNGAYAENEYGGRPSWVYHIYDTDGDTVTFNNITKEYFDDKGGARHSTSGWGPLAINTYSSSKFVGIKKDGSITTNLEDEVVGFIGMSGNSWWPGKPEKGDATHPAYDADNDGDYGEYENGVFVDDMDRIETDDSPYWDERFAILAEDAADIEQTQTHWGFAISYGGQTFTAPDIMITSVPEPATMSLLALGCMSLGGIALLRRRGR